MDFRFLAGADAMDGLQTQVVTRLPLAEATYRVLAHILNDDILDGLYDLYRGHGYAREISFPTLVWLIHDALFIHPSARQAIAKARESGRLSAENSSVYQKLGRLNLNISMALVRQTSPLLSALLPPAARQPALPASLAGFDGVIIDGKTIKHVTHRLKVTRPFRGHVTSGKLLAALSLNGELVRAIEATPDSCTNDVPLIPGLLGQLQLQRRDDRPLLFIADRQFGGIQVPLELCRDGNYFLIRLQNKIGFEVDPSRPAGKGVDERGLHYTEEWGWMGTGRKLYCRRIVLHRPGLDDLVVQTDLTDEQAYPAVDLLAAYAERWTIERVFQAVTEVYELRHLIGSTPRGTIFQAAFCMLMYNVLQVLKSHVAAGGNLSPRQVSGELLFDDATAEMTAWNRLLSVEATVEVVSQPLETGTLRDYLGERLQPLWTPRWLKSPKRKPTEYQKKRRPPSGSICVYRALQAEKRRSERERRDGTRHTRNRHNTRSPT
jgi:hypothetical protein